MKPIVHICRFFAILAMVLAGIAGAQSPQIVLPSQPSEIEFVRGRILNLSLPSASHAVADVKVEYANGRLLIQPVFIQVAVPDPGSPATLLRDVDFDIGRLPGGDYPVEVALAGSSAAIATATLAVKPHADPLRTNISGHYWNPNESGWGMMVWNRVADDAVFGVWFTYQDNKPYWVALSSEGVGSREKVSSGAFRSLGPTFPVIAVEMRGPPLAPQFDASKVRQYQRLYTQSGQPGTFAVKDSWVASYLSPGDANPPFQLSGSMPLGAAYQTNMPIARPSLSMELFRP